MKKTFYTGISHRTIFQFFSSLNSNIIFSLFWNYFSTKIAWTVYIFFLLPPTILCTYLMFSLILSWIINGMCMFLDQSVPSLLNVNIGGWNLIDFRGKNLGSNFLSVKLKAFWTHFIDIYMHCILYFIYYQMILFIIFAWTLYYYIYPNYLFKSYYVFQK